jgi:hypothetical protein
MQKDVNFRHGTFEVTNVVRKMKSSSLFFHSCECKTMATTSCKDDIPANYTQSSGIAHGPFTPYNNVADDQPRRMQ